MKEEEKKGLLCWIEEKVRCWIITFVSAWRRNWFKQAVQSADYCHIGFSGTGQTAFDKDTIKKRDIQSLDRFGLWLLKTFIEGEKERRWQCFRQASIDVTGEDPEVDPLDAYPDELAEFEEEFLRRETLSMFSG